MHRTAAILVSLGLAAGALGGLLGIGGGALVVPGLVFFLGFNQHKAHGTSLAVVLCMSAGSVATYWSHGNIDWRLAGEMAVGGVAGAWLGTKVVSAIKGKVLRRVFCVFMALVGIRMIFDGCLTTHGAPDRATHRMLSDGMLFAVAAALATGLTTGFMSALLGIGGGVVMVPAMVLLLCVSQHTAQGVSLAAMMPTAFTGMVLHREMGNVDFRVAKWVGLGAIAGGIAGSSVAGSLDASLLKLIFGLFLVMMSVLMAVRR